MDQNTLNIVINLDVKGQVQNFSLSETPINSLFMRRIPLIYGVSETKCHKCSETKFIEIFANTLDVLNSSNPINQEIKSEPLLNLNDFDTFQDSSTLANVTVFENEDCPDRIDIAKLVTVVVKEELKRDDEFENEESDRCTNSPDASDSERSHKSTKKRKRRSKSSDSETIVTKLKSDKIKTVSEKLPCNTCTKIFKTSYTLEKHKRNCPPSANALTCKKCGYEAKRILQLRAHERHCTGTPKGEPKCDICNKTFCNWQYVRTHQNLVHKGMLSFCCETCGEKFKTSKAFAKHKLKHTDNPRPYICDICGKRYPLKQSIREHIMLKHVESFEGMVFCYQCNPPRKLFSEGILRLHESRQHSEARVAPCPQCGKVVKTENIKAHIFRFHTPANKKKRLFCEVAGCNYSTTGKNALNVHKYTHLDDSAKPFHCSFCQKGFSDNFKKQRHEMIHTGERP